MQADPQSVASLDRARKLSGVEATRAAIKAAARKLFASHGYEATSIRQIADAMAMKGGSLYYHFRSKEEILFAILDEGNRVLIDAAQDVLRKSPDDVVQQLRGLVRAHVRVLASNPMQFMVVTRELAQLKGARRKRIVAQRTEYERIIRSVLDRGVSEQRFRKFNVKVVSFGLIGFLNGVAYWFNPRGELSSDEIAAEYTEVILSGLLRRSP